MFYNENKREKGITTLALIVTIIVLLILAGVVIASLSGENGIITRAQYVRNQTEYTHAREEVMTKWAEVQMDNIRSDFSDSELASKLEEKLLQVDENAHVAYNSSNKTFEIFYKGHNLEIDAIGNLTSNRDQAVEKIKDTWDNINNDSSLSDSEKLDKLAEDLNIDRSKISTDENGDIIINDYNGYNEIIKSGEEGEDTVVEIDLEMHDIIYASSDYNGVYDGNEHSIEINVREPSATTIYYSTQVELDSENYILAGSTTKPILTNANESGTIYWYIESGNSNYHNVAGRNSVTIEKSTPVVTLSENTGILNFNETQTISATVSSNPSINGTWKVTSSNADNVEILSGNDETATNGVETQISFKAINATTEVTTITVQFVPTDTTNYNIIEHTFTVSGVSKINAVNPTVEAYNGAYDGNPHSVTVTPESGETLGGTIEYSIDQTNWSETKPTVTNVADSKTIYVRVRGDSNHNTTDPVSANITVTKANLNPQVSMEGFTYGDTQSIPTISGNAENGEVTYYYSTEDKTEGGINWNTVADSTSLPAGTYYMYATVAETANYNGITTPNTVSFTIEKSTPVMEFETTTGTADYNTTNTFTITPPLSGTWTVTSSDPESVAITRINNSAELENAVATANMPTTIEYKGLSATDEPVTITIVFTPNDTVNHNPITLTYTVNSINKTQAIAPVLANTTNTYDGEAHTIEVTSAGSGGTIQYRASTNGGSTYGNWQPTLPTITNTTEATNGTLYVQAQVVGDNNHTDSEIVTATCHIGYATMSVVGTNYSGTYDGNAHSITVTVNKPTSGTNIYYRNGVPLTEGDIYTNGNLKSEAQLQSAGITTLSPAVTNVSESTRIYWCVVDTTKNYSTLAGSNTITITSKTINTTGMTINLSQPSFTYDGNSHTPTATITDGTVGSSLTIADFDLSYSNSTTNNDNRTTAGTVTITATGKGNYTGTITATYTIDKANVTLSDLLSGTQYVAKDETSSFTAKSSVPGKWTVTSANANVEITAGNNQTNASNNISFKGKTASETSTEVTVAFVPTDTTNYNTPTPQKFNVLVTDFTSNLDNNNALLHVNGSNQTITLSGANIGQLSITDGSNATTKENNTAKITLNQTSNELTIEPKSAGTTSVTIREANGNKTVTINIEVKKTTIKANGQNPLEITTHVGAVNTQVTLSGDNAGAFSIKTQPNSSYVTASITGNILTITPKGATPSNEPATMVVKEANGNQEVAINITVNKSIPTVTLSAQSGSVDYNGTATFTATAQSTPAINGTWTVTSSRPGNIEITAGNGATATNGTATNITYKGLSAIDQTTIISVMFIPEDTINYSPSVKSFTVNSVNKITALNPTLTAYSGNYDGQSHSISVSPSVGTSLGGIIEYSTDQTNWSETKPTRTDYGVTTVYVHVKGDSNHITSPVITSTITIDSTAMTYTSGDYNGVYDEGPHSITLNVTEPTGTTIYYSTQTELNKNNYSTAGSETKPTATNVADSGNVYWYIKSNSDNYNDVWGRNSVTITKANASNPTLTAYEGTYDGASHTIAVAGQYGGTLSYSTDNTNWSQALPTRTNAGTTTVYAKVIGDNNHNSTEPVSSTIKINKSNPNVTLSSATGTVNYNSTTTFTAKPVSTPAVNGTWQVTSGTPANVEITAGNGATATNNTETNITYKGKSATTTQVNITVKFTPNDTENYNVVQKTYTVNSVNKVSATNPTLTPYTGTYDGTSHTIGVSGGSGGTIQYSTDDTNWSTTKPTATNVSDSKTVYVRVQGDSNHITTASISSTITINRANISPAVTMSGYTYGGTKSTPSISGNTGNGDVTYYYRTTEGNTDGTNWTAVTSSTSLNAGTYYMYATVGQTANYNGATSSSVAFTIAKASPSITFSAPSGTVNYNSTTTFTAKPVSTPAVNGKWAVSSSNPNAVQITAGNNASATDNTNTNISYKGLTATSTAVTITVIFTPSDTTNYNTVQKTYSVTAVNKVKATAPVLANTTNTYDGDPHTIEVTSAGSGGTIQYRASTNGGSSYGNWQATLPTITRTTDATGGTLYIQAQVVGDSNHTNSDTVTATCHIGYATMDVTGTNYSGTYDGTSHSITVTVKKPTSGTKTYYRNGSSLTESDLYTNGTLKTQAQLETAGITETSPTVTNVTTSTRIYWCVIDTTKNYSTLTGSNTITITPKTINTSGMTINLSQPSYTYDGNAHTPTATITDGTVGSSLTIADFDLSYSNSTTNNDNRTTAGTVTVTATGKGNYTGTITTTYTIAKANVTLSDIPSGTQYVAKDATKSFTAKSSVPGKWTVSSANANVEITAGNNQTNASNAISYKGKTAAETATTITVAFTPTDTTNYNTPTSKTFNVLVTDITSNATNNSVVLYVNGNSKTVALSGTNMGTLSIQTASDEAKAKTTLTNNTLTIEPKSAGTTSVVVKESRANRTITINIEVKATTIKANNANPLNLTTNVGASSTAVSISGENAGSFSITRESDSTIATATLSGSTLTVTPVKAGSSTVIISESNGNQSVTINITVNKATPSVTLSATSGTVTYGGTTSFTAKPVSTPAVNGTWQVSSNTPENVEITGGDGATATNNTATTITYKGKTATTTAVTITVVFTPSDTANYNTVTKTYTVSKVNKANATNPTLTAYVGNYNGQAHTITVSGGSGGTIQYSTDNSTWNTTKPTRTDYGTTTVYVRVLGDSNHNTTTAISSTITINTTSIGAETGNYSGTYDGQAHTITVNVTQPTGATIYYSATTQLKADNYSTAGSTTNPGKTNVADSGTVYWYIKSNSANYDDLSGSNTVTITRANASNPTLTAYEGTYDGNAHTITVSGGSGGTIQYSTDNKTWNTTKPTRTAYGTTTVYVKVVGDANHNSTTATSSTIKINKATPTVTLSASSGTVDYGATTTFTAKPTSTPAVNGTWTVTSGTPANVEITAGDGANATNNTATNITYKGKAATSTAVTITVTFTPSDTTNYNTAENTYSVTKVNKVNAVNPTLTAYSGAYDGGSHTIGVTGGSGGTIQYSTDNSSWSTTKPSATNVADSKTVYVRVVGDSNHNTTTSISSTITINRANITPTVSMSGYTYGGTKSTPSTSGNTGSGTVTYYYRTTSGNTDGTNWTAVTSSTSLNAGTYYMYATVAQTDNYNGATSSAVEFTIAKASPTITLSATSGNVNYGASKTFTAKPVTTPAVNGTWSVSSSSPSNVQITAGNEATATNNTATNITYKGAGATTSAVTITVVFNPSNPTNYNTAQATYTVTAVNKVQATAPVLANTTNTYSGTAYKVQTTSNGSGGTLKYRSSTDNSTWGSWTTSSPTITNVGTLYVQAKVVGDANHTDSSTASATATVTISGMSYTGNSDITLPYDGQAHKLNIQVSKPASGAVVYYSKTALTDSNYSSGATTCPAVTNASESTTIYWYIKSNSTNYSNVSGNNKITINTKAITGSDITVTLNTSSYTYNGSSQTPTTTVKDTTRNVNLTNGTDYTLSYKHGTTNTDNRTQAGTITITITAKGNYTGSTTKTYTINKANVTLSSIPTTLQYVGVNETKLFTAKSTVSGKWAVSSSNSNISITAGNNQTNASNSISYKGITANTTATTITVSFTPTDTTNYNTPASKTFQVKATECIASPTELTLTAGSTNGTVTLSGTNHGTFEITTESPVPDFGYETTFPMNNKPSWIGILTNGTEGYGFTVDGSTLKSNNYHVNSSVAHSYIPIDLSQYTSDDKVKITVYYTISSESASWDYGSVAISTNASQTYSETTGRFIGNVGGTTTSGNNNTTVSGGSLYYLHFYYRKDSSVDSYDDCFKINSIKFETVSTGQPAQGTYRDTYISASISGTTLTVTPKEPTQNPITLTIKEGNGGKTTTIAVTVLMSNYKVDEQKYAQTFAEAMGYANENSSIRLLQSYSDSTVPTINKSVSLDLEANTLVLPNPITINQNKTLTLKGESQSYLVFSGSGITNTGIENNGTLKIATDEYITCPYGGYDCLIENNGTFDVQGNITYNSSSRMVNNSGDINITGGTYSHYNISSRTINMNYGSFNMDGGTFNLYGTSGSNGISGGSAGTTQSYDIKDSTINTYSISELFYTTQCDKITKFNMVGTEVTETGSLAEMLYSGVPIDSALIKDTTITATGGNCTPFYYYGTGSNFIFDNTEIKVTRCSTARALKMPGSNQKVKILNCNFEVSASSYASCLDGCVGLEIEHSYIKSEGLGSSGSVYGCWASNQVKMSDTNVTIEGLASSATGIDAEELEFIDSTLTANLTNAYFFGIDADGSTFIGKNSEINITHSGSSDNSVYGFRDNTYTQSEFDNVEINIVEDGSSKVYGLYQYSDSADKNLTIKSGKISAISGNSNAYGLCLTSAQNTVNIGDPSDTLSTTSPEIIGSTNAIYSTGSTGYGDWNFYNGILKGKSSAYNRDPVQTRTGYAKIPGTATINNETYKTIHLGTVTAGEVSYTPSDNSWNPGTVQNALDTLYTLLQ